jgi:hypothetical protein
MTADGRTDGVGAPEPGHGAGPLAAVAPGGPSEMLELCDALLDEIGRRSHLFGWLHDPEGGRDRWLPVDAYYPRNRIVVICRDHPSPHDRVYGEQIPAHDLLLLTLRPADLGADPEGPRSALRSALQELGLPRAAPVPQPPRAGVVARAVASLSQPIAEPEPAPVPRPPRAARAQAAERAARFVAEHQPGAARPAKTRAASALGPTRARRAPRALAAQDALAPRRAPGPRRTLAAEELSPRSPGVAVGVVLALVLYLEAYVAVGALGIREGEIVLAFGLALDGAARALGAIAASRVARQDWAWLCVLVGSPAVAALTLFEAAGPVKVDPAPLAGLVCAAAAVVIALAVLGGLVGI